MLNGIASVLSTDNRGESSHSMQLTFDRAILEITELSWTAGRCR